ncbi:sensor histidine kinase [Deinococcus yavapaiensis]|uniref:histidine kinase n=1 Tax=Deinococcus yavapaiensis KR-236 TaxID=694435 RepID=A0A318S167_9DEIO|nr:PAS domain-containing sensor histidine kinase [Deinococcus yavapaiensis]PYE50976.1 PAS domain S-box-containing protein [Deinococcus yavapaiensis KR-236]
MTHDDTSGDHTRAASNEAPPDPHATPGSERALFEHAPNAALLLTPHGRIHDVNVRGRALLEAEHAPLVGQAFTRFLTPASHSTLSALLRRVFDTPGVHREEVQLLRHDGTVRDVAVDAVAFDVNGAPTCYLTLTDVDAFKRAHQHLSDVNTHLERQLRQRTARIQGLNEEFEHVINATDNELRTVLSRAQNFLWLHRRDQPQEPREEDENVSRADGAVQQALSLLNSLEQYMRTRSMRVRVRDVDLNHVLREVSKDMQALLKGRDVRFDPPSLPTVQGDSQVLHLILFEYVSNALKFSRSHDVLRLQVRVEETDGEYRIGVQDDGVGFNMRSKDKLFKMFGRLHPSGEYEGTGLGLVCVRRLCERFGGRAWGEGKPGSGATFWFSWPKVPLLLD